VTKNPHDRNLQLKRITALKPGAIQVILPDWFPPSMEEIISFLLAMAEAADPIGLVLYNPPHSKKKLTPEDFYTIRKAGIPLWDAKLPQETTNGMHL